MQTVFDPTVIVWSLLGGMLVFVLVVCYCIFCGKSDEPEGATVIKEYDGERQRTTYVGITEEEYKRETEPPRQVEQVKTVEQKTVVLVICPHCGMKNEQGITQCENCKAMM